MNHPTTAIVLSCLLLGTLCPSVHADGFKFPTIPNPFKKPVASEATAASETTRPTRSATASGGGESAAREPSSFSLPKPKLPKFDLPSLGGESSAASTGSRPPQNATSTRQSRASQNRSTGPSALDKFSRGTKNFFGKAKTTLMPWTSDTAAATSMRPGAPSGSGSRHSSRTNRSGTPAREASTSSGFTFPWSKSKPATEEKKEVNSATDFLKLDRPKYY